MLSKYTNWIVVGVVVVVGVLLYALNRSPNLNINKDVQSKCITAINDKTFCKFAGVFANAGDYRAVMTMTSGSDRSVADIKVAANGNKLMAVTQNGKSTGQIEVFSGITYVNVPGSGWYQYASTSKNIPSVTDMRAEMLKADYKNDKGQKEQYLNKGTENKDNFKCFKYQVVDPAKPQQTSYLWFDTKHYLLRQATSTDSSQTVDIAVTYAAANITQPSPIVRVIE